MTDETQELIHPLPHFDRRKSAITGVGGAGRASTISSKSHRQQILAYTDTEVFEVIKGPIAIQMAFHYGWYGILLLIAHFAQWTYIWWWMYALYIFTAYTTWEISRINAYLNPKTMVPLYLSFIPYLVFHIMARQAHQLFGIFWFISLMIINLQISTQTLRIHVVSAVTIFIGELSGVLHQTNTRKACYIALINIVHKVYSQERANTFVPANDVTLFQVTSCNTVLGTNSYQKFLQLNPVTGETLCLTGQKLNINFASEVTVISCIVLVGISLLMLQMFIQEYAFNLLDRQNQVVKLSKQNEDLKTQLNALKKEIDLDLDSPITKVIKSIKSIQERGDFGVDVMESLDYVIQILSSNQLFMPNLNVTSDAMDSDVNKWLTSMITNKTETAQPMLLQDDNKIGPSKALNKMTTGAETKIFEYLKEIDSWDFDIFKLGGLSNGQPLFYLALAVIESHNLVPLFNLDETVIRKFLVAIESGYNPVTYHNSYHAADVLHALHYFITDIGLRDILTNEEILACVVAAAIHDYDHPGYNNGFLVNSGAMQALRYNDQAVLENYHCASAFELMLSDPSLNVLSSLSTERFKQVRASILSMVLATDMAGHFEYIAKFKNKLSGSGLEYQDQKDRQLLMDIAIKCGDINNATKNNDLCRLWAGRIMDEFFLQGEKEKQIGLPVSMFMDRATTMIPKCQVGFIDYIVTPLFEAWGLFVRSEEREFPGLANMAKNREFWKKLQDEGVADGTLRNWKK